MHERSAFWLFKKCMNGPAVATIKERLTILLNDANRDEGTITTYAGVVNHPLLRYITDAITAKTDDEVCNFTKG